MQAPTSRFCLAERVDRTKKTGSGWLKAAGKASTCTPEEKTAGRLPSLDDKCHTAPQYVVRASIFFYPGQTPARCYKSTASVEELSWLRASADGQRETQFVIGCWQQHWFKAAVAYTDEQRHVIINLRLLRQKWTISRFDLHATCVIIFSLGFLDRI